MSIFSNGVMPEVSKTGRFWKLDVKGANVAYVMPSSLDSILTAPKFGVFTGSGAPFNASWVSVGPKDVGNELGLKAQPKAFIWVWVPNNPKNLSEGGSAKIWECNKTHYDAISTQVSEFGQPLRGLMLILTKKDNRWNLTANVPPASRAVSEEVLKEAWDELGGLDGTDQEEFGKLVGVNGKTPELQRKFLIERSQGKFNTWSEVLQAFGLEAEKEENDVEGY